VYHIEEIVDKLCYRINDSHLFLILARALHDRLKVLYSYIHTLRLYIQESRPKMLQEDSTPKYAYSYKNGNYLLLTGGRLVPRAAPFSSILNLFRRSPSSPSTFIPRPNGSTAVKQQIMASNTSALCMFPGG
jgi:hypothetical protein